MEQVCRNCKMEKDASCFGKDKRLELGLKYFCKSCLNLLYNETRKLWKKNNKDKIRDQNSRYSSSHKAVIASNESKRRARKLQATPKWLSKEQTKEIRQFYTDAEECEWLSEGGLHVDHIVPLQGKNVSGLHVPWNLQILPGPENCSKGNRF